MTFIRRLITFWNKDNIIQEEAKRRKDVVYGSQALRLRGGFLAREPGDWDLFSNKPQVSARNAERKLDRLSGGDNYFVKKAQHSGTYKLQEKGPDNKPNTLDDLQVADYTKRPRNLKFGLVNGVRVIDLESIRRDKLKSIKDPVFNYRKDKDLEDLKRIRVIKKIEGYPWR